MDQKNFEALTYGPEHMLGVFANLPDKPGDSKAAEEFRERFGELFSGLDPENYWVHVAGFRKAWHAKNQFELAAVGAYLTSIFERGPSFDAKLRPALRYAILAGDPRYLPAIMLSFSSGKTTLVPVTLLDWLAISLLDYRRKLGICKREGCTTPCFVKMHPRARYCSEECFHQSRQRKKNQWWKDNRGKGSEKPTPTHKRRTKKSRKKGK